MKKRKIILFTISPAGVKRHISMIVKYLNRDKFELAGIFPVKAINERWRAAGAGEYREIFEQNNVRYYIVELPRNINLIDDFLALIKIIKILKKEEPDIFHCHSSMAGFIGRVAAKFVRIPKVIYTPHTVYYAWLSGIKKFFYFNIEKFLLFFCDYIVAVSPSEEEYLKKTLKTKKVIRINNGINIEDIEKFSTDELAIKNKLQIDNNTKILLTVTRLSPPKDTFTLLKAVNIVKDKLKNFVLLIAGDGEQREELQDFVKKINIESFVKFLGWREDIFDLIAVCDIAILSSEREGLPYAIIEPSAFGKPVIGTDTYGIKDCIVHNKTGYLFEKGDYNKLSEYIIDLLIHSDKAKLFGTNGKKFIKENFDINDMIKKLEELYEMC